MITKIDNDKFQIKTETVEEVSLSQLEQELANLEKLEAEANEFNAWVDTLPEERKMYIQRQHIVVPIELVERINKLKELNADTL